MRWLDFYVVGMDRRGVELGEFLPSMKESMGSTLEPYKPGMVVHTYCLGTQRFKEEEKRRRKKKGRGRR